MSIARIMLLAFSMTLPVTATADLWVESIQPQAGSVPPPPAGSVIIDYVIHNRGNASATAFYIGGYSTRSTGCAADLELEDEVFITSLEPGERFAGSYVLHTRLGDIALFGVVRADTRQTVPEGNEANNCEISHLIKVQRADLVVQQVTGMNPLRITPGGEPAYIETEIKNQGTLETGWTAGASTIRYYVTIAATDPPQTDRLALETDIPALQRNASVSQAALIRVAADFPLGTYNLIAMADGNNEIAEHTETNNIGPAHRLEVVAAQAHADIDGSGRLDILDHIQLLNEGTVTLEDASNQHLNQRRSPYPFPEMIQSDDYLTARSQWGGTPTEHSEAMPLEFTLTQSGTAWQVHAELEGEVIAINIYVKLPPGYNLEQARAEDALASGYVDALQPSEPERVLLNQRTLIRDATYLEGSVHIATLEASAGLDLSQLETVTDPAEFKCGIAVNVHLAGGQQVTQLKRFTYVEIPDPAFRACVEEVLGLVPEDPIPSSLATTVTELHMENKGIADLTGIEGFTNLEVLLVTNNQITALPDLSKLTDLEILDANYNQLIRIGNLPGELTLLFIAHNQLSQLPNLSHITPLWVLNVENNQLQSLPSLTYNTQMEVLSCKENLLTSLPDLPASIKNLMAHDNRLTHLPDMTGISANNFDLHNNYFTNLTPLASLTFPAGAWLFLDYNNLDPTDCSSLRRLSSAVDNYYLFPQNSYDSFLCRNE